eukprot:3849101-Amphidinium_carterae.1
MHGIVPLSIHVLMLQVVGLFAIGKDVGMTEVKQTGRRNHQTQAELLYMVRSHPHKNIRSSFTYMEAITLAPRAGGPRFNQE